MTLFRSIVTNPGTTWSYTGEVSEVSSVSDSLLNKLRNKLAEGHLTQKTVFNMKHAKRQVVQETIYNPIYFLFYFLYD